MARMGPTATTPTATRFIKRDPEGIIVLVLVLVLLDLYGLYGPDGQNGQDEDDLSPDPPL